MKKYLNILLFLIIAISFTIINIGCDEFNNFPVNIPISKQIDATGSNNNIFGTGDYCIDQESKTFQDFREKTKSLTFIQAAYRTKSVTANGIAAPNLNGDIVITVRKENTDLLFTVTIPNTNPSDYINKAFVLSLNQNQIQLMNTYFGSLQNTCFNATIEVKNITGGTPTYEVKGIIDMVFEADTEL
jgi:hypothetical protein